MNLPDAASLATSDPSGNIKARQEIYHTGSLSLFNTCTGLARLTRSAVSFICCSASLLSFPVKPKIIVPEGVIPALKHLWKAATISSAVTFFPALASCWLLPLSIPMYTIPRPAWCRECNSASLLAKISLA